MVTVKRYTPELQAKWDCFVDRSKNGIFMFKRGYVEYHSDRFEDCSLLFFDENNNCVALMPASRHGSEVRSHGGLTFGGLVTGLDMKQHHMLDCFRAMRDLLISEGITSILYKKIPYIYYNIPAEEDAYALFVNGAKLIRRDAATVIDLPQKIKVTKGRHAQIARAAREGVEVKESDDFDSFIALENEILMRFHGVKAVHTGVELYLLKTRFPDNIKLYVARLNGELIAGSVIFIYPDLIHTQYMASNDKGRRIGALDLIISNLMTEEAI